MSTLAPFVIRPGEPGFRRNQLIDPRPGRIEAEIEDDYHHFRVALDHDGTVVTSIQTEAVRWPWSTCPAAGVHLASRLTGVRLDALAAIDPPQAHCTHQHELALIAAGHAHDTAPTVYSTFVRDAVDGVRLGETWRNGEKLIAWEVRGSVIISRPHAGYELRRLKAWEEELPIDLRVPGRILRRVLQTSLGREFAFEQASTADQVASSVGACYTFQPERSATGTATAVIRTFTEGPAPLADRLDALARREAG